MAIEIASSLDTPGICVIEAPMGEGKTEAAMYLADRWGICLRQRGIYFALPTRRPPAIKCSGACASF